jgi:CII-binding regulator of phage lambda lysogenization HflD
MHTYILEAIERFDVRWMKDVRNSNIYMHTYMHTYMQDTLTRKEKELANLKASLEALQHENKTHTCTQDTLTRKEKELADLNARFVAVQHANKKLEDKVEHLQDQVEFWDAEVCIYICIYVCMYVCQLSIFRIRSSFGMLRCVCIYTCIYIYI